MNPETQDANDGDAPKGARQTHWTYQMATSEVLVWLRGLWVFALIGGLIVTMILAGWKLAELVGLAG